MDLLNVNSSTSRQFHSVIDSVELQVIDSEPTKHNKNCSTLIDIVRININVIVRHYENTELLIQIYIWSFAKIFRDYKRF